MRLLNEWNCYVLVLEVTCSAEVELARRTVTLKPGVYFYVGSSRGPGGALARIARHLSKRKKAWWHIDKLILSPCSSVRGFYLLLSACEDCEVEVSRSLAKFFEYVSRFGSTDKPKSPSHLFACLRSFEECVCEVYMALEGLECIVDTMYVSASNHSLDSSTLVST